LRSADAGCVKSTTGRSGASSGHGCGAAGLRGRDAQRSLAAQPRASRFSLDVLLMRGIADIRWRVVWSSRTRAMRHGIEHAVAACPSNGVWPHLLDDFKVAGYQGLVGTTPTSRPTIPLVWPSHSSRLNGLFLHGFWGSLTSSMLLPEYTLRTVRCLVGSWVVREVLY
jgi:hypothetical protein